MVWSLGYGAGQAYKHKRGIMEQKISWHLTNDSWQLLVYYLTSVTSVSRHDPVNGLPLHLRDPPVSLARWHAHELGHGHEPAQFDAGLRHPTQGHTGAQYAPGTKRRDQHDANTLFLFSLWDVLHKCPLVVYGFTLRTWLVAVIDSRLCVCVSDSVLARCEVHQVHFLRSALCSACGSVIQNRRKNTGWLR